jgi:hypothetical protein
LNAEGAEVAQKSQKRKKFKVLDSSSLRLLCALCVQKMHCLQQGADDGGAPIHLGKWSCQSNKTIYQRQLQDKFQEYSNEHRND